MASEKSRVFKGNRNYKNYKIGKLVIKDNQCDKCLCKHSILTCEHYCRTIPKKVLQNKCKCEFYVRKKNI